jgi:hypothetical protein
MARKKHILHLSAPYLDADPLDPASSSFATDFTKLILSRSRVPDAYIAKAPIQVPYSPSPCDYTFTSRDRPVYTLSTIQYEVRSSMVHLIVIFKLCWKLLIVTAPPYDPACLQRTEGYRPQAGENVHAMRKMSCHLQYQRLVVGKTQHCHESSDRGSSAFIPAHTSTR